MIFIPIHIKSDVNIMNQISDHINIVLICSSITGLTTFIHLSGSEDTSLTFLLPFLLTFIPIPNHHLIIRSLYCIVATLSLICVFLPYIFVSSLVASFSLGLMFRLGYHLTNQLFEFNDKQTTKIYEGAMNISMSIGVLLSIFANFMKLTLVTAKLLVLVSTLGNFYLISIIRGEKSSKNEVLKSKVAFSLVPIYM